MAETIGRTRFMLGLKDGTVRLAASSPTWESAFREERELLGRALSDFQCEIEHIGSTAVPGLIAKPILDIGVGLAAGESAAPCVPRIEELGYRYGGDAEASGGHIFTKEVRELITTHHIHVVNDDDPQWNAYLLFRDYLRENKPARELYAQRKQTLALQHPTDRRAYMDGKDEIVAKLLLEAKAGGCELD